MPVSFKLTSFNTEYHLLTLTTGACFVVRGQSVVTRSDKLVAFPNEDRAKVYIRALDLIQSSGQAQVSIYAVPLSKVIDSLLQDMPLEGPYTSLEALKQPDVDYPTGSETNAKEGDE